VKGISLFITPKFLVNDDGTLGKRNDIYCAGIEHKLGIHASPTTTMNYGEKEGGATAFLIGEENLGLKYMFIMMNAARFSVGVQGYAVADRAYQAAVDYAKERVQSKDVAAKEWTPVRIIEHPDVRRMLLTQKALVEVQRTLARTQTSLDNLDRNVIDANAPVQRGLDDTLQELQRTARALRVLSDYLQQHPESLLRGKPSDPPVPPR